jgi:hypothetical protein
MLHARSGWVSIGQAYIVSEAMHETDVEGLMTLYGGGSTLTIQTERSRPPERQPRRKGARSQAAPAAEAPPTTNGRQRASQRLWRSAVTFRHDERQAIHGSSGGRV